MVKYVDTQVVFREIPDEIALAINISGCPNHCENCHSSYLANDIGTELSFDNLFKLITSNSGITCVVFMGGDQNPSYINLCAEVIKQSDLSLKTAWYSGKQELNPEININNFNYIKLGPYVPNKGPLDNSNTNQKMFLVKDNNLIDITYKFWGKQ